MKDKIICGIYKITNPKGKVYIGQSVNILSTFKNRYCNINCKSQRLIYNSIKKYGWENHKSEILHECIESELNQLEIYYSQLFNSTKRDAGLNIRECGGSKGKFSEETKMIMSNIQKSRFKNNPEERERIGNINRGKKFSIEFKKKLSDAAIGRKHSEEAKLKVSNSLLGNKRNFGKKWTEEHKKRMSMIHKGKVNSPEARRKLSIANTGKKHSEETKRKLSEHFKGRKVSREIVEKNCKIILNVETGIFYIGAKDVAIQMGVSELSASRRLNGYLINKTSLIYV